MTNSRILITSPSLNTKDNVSGISSLVINILNYSSFSISHFVLGKKDNEKKGVRWAFKQIKTILDFIKISKGDHYEILHLNTGLEKASIIRDSLIAFIARKIYKKKVLLHIHGGYYLLNEGAGIVQYCLKSLVQSAKAVIVLSQDEKKVFADRFNITNCFVLPNAIDYPFINIRKEQPETDKINMIFLGRINATKGLNTITNSLGRLNGELKRLNFKVYGAGPQHQEWDNQLKNINGLDYKYEGVAETKAKWEALEKADVFVLPSIQSEGLPIAMLEAMAAGCAVITTNDGSIGSVIEHNKNGILISKDSPAELAATLKKIIKGEIDIKQLGKNASDFIKNKFTFPVYINKLEKIYTSLV